MPSRTLIEAVISISICSTARARGSDFSFRVFTVLSALIGTEEAEMLPSAGS